MFGEEDDFQELGPHVTASTSNMHRPKLGSSQKAIDSKTDTTLCFLHFLVLFHGDRPVKMEPRGVIIESLNK